MTNDTTAQATVLTVEEQRACWAAILTHGENCHDSPLLPYPHTAPADAVTLLQNHIDALTEQVRVLREALRKCDELDTIDEGYGEIAEVARRALAALERSGE